MRNILKHKPEKKIKIKSKNTQYLRKESIQYNSVESINEENEIKTLNNFQGAVYTYSFQTPMGLTDEMDEKNRKRFTQLIDIMNGNFKVYILNEKRNLLAENVQLLKEKTRGLNPDTDLADVSLNRYMIMKNLEKLIYSTPYIIVSSDIYKFEDTARSFLNLEKVEGDRLLDFIELLNNGFGGVR